MNKIRTRYAPSPTGFLHIGGARTALFCYLFAKHFNGDFIFRLEDTDVKRNVEGGEASQLDNLAWLGIIPDESPLKPNLKYGKYRQSEKLDRYKEVLDMLLEKNLAYKAYDLPEELEAQKLESEQKGFASFRYDPSWLKISDEEKAKRDLNNQFSYRIKMPKDKVFSWNDLVRGEISFSSNEISDWVIFKSDNYPTYNFAVVVDDHDMQISHVLRGEEHIGNTPKQLALYDYLNWSSPQYGHLTIITDMGGKKLSKRDLSLKQFIEDYKNEGYIPHAIFNFLALLGWTSEDTKEVMSKKELISKFNPARLSKSPSKFDVNKMSWFSKIYMKNQSNEEVQSHLDFKDFNSNSSWKEIFTSTFKESATTYLELQKALNNYLNPMSSELVLNEEELKVVKEFKANLKSFTVEEIQAAINLTASNLKLKGKALFMPIRKACTYLEHGPELAKAIYLFGEKLITERLAKYEN